MWWADEEGRDLTPHPAHMLCTRTAHDWLVLKRQEGRQRCRPDGWIGGARAGAGPDPRSGLGGAGLRTGRLDGRAARLVDRAARLAGTANSCRDAHSARGGAARAVPRLRGQRQVGGWDRLSAALAAAE